MMRGELNLGGVKLVIIRCGSMASLANSDGTAVSVLFALWKIPNVQEPEKKEILFGEFFSYCIYSSKFSTQAWQSN